MTLAAWIKPALADSLIPLLFAYAAWTVQGWHKDKVIAELHQKAAESSATAARRLTAATERVRALEHLVQDGFDDRTEQFKKEIQNAKRSRDRFIAGVRNGTIRLSIPATCAGAAPSPDTTAAAGSENETRAELDPAAASALEAIAGEGDDGIRQLNTCIDDYNAVREKYNVQTK